MRPFSLFNSEASRRAVTLLLAGACLVAAAPATDAGSIRLVPASPLRVRAPTDTCRSDACKELLGLIRGAKERIDFAVYGVRHQSAILAALADAKRRGVVLRGVVDKDSKDATYYSETDELEVIAGDVVSDHLHDAARAAKFEPYRATADRCARPEGRLGPLQCVGYDLGDSCLIAGLASREELDYDGDIMHDKFFVVDGRYVWTGSANISDSDITGYNANVVVVIDSPELAGRYLAELDQLHAGLFHEAKSEVAGGPIQVGDATVTVWFPPQGDPIAALRESIQGATARIDVSVFYLTQKQLTGDLIAAHRRGVKVRVIVDATSAVNDYTKHPLLRAAGVPVKVEDWGGKMHAKAAVIDGRVVYAGSMNWTSAGSNNNDENILRIESEAQAAVFQAWFDTLWDDIDEQWLTERPAAESLQSRGSCTDRIDNDFDDLSDAQDPGCGDDPQPLPELPPWQIVPKEDGHDLVKGNVSEEGKKTYHVPTGEYYAQARIDLARGEQWFCSEDDARAAGFRRSSR